jgi:hypothetical protein
MTCVVCAAMTHALKPLENFQKVEYVCSLETCCTAEGCAVFGLVQYAMFYVENWTVNCIIFQLAMDCSSLFLTSPLCKAICTQEKLTVHTQYSRE